jgi:hypothetical protein
LRIHHFARLRQVLFWTKAKSYRVAFCLERVSCFDPIVGVCHAQKLRILPLFATAEFDARNVSDWT